MRRVPPRPQAEDNSWPALADTFTLFSGVILILLLFYASSNRRQPPPSAPPAAPADSGAARCQEELGACRKGPPPDQRILAAQDALEKVHKYFLKPTIIKASVFAEPERHQSYLYVALPLAEIPFKWNTYQLDGTEAEIQTQIVPVIKGAIHVIKDSRRNAKTSVSGSNVTASQDGADELDPTKLIQLEISGHADSSSMKECNNDIKCIRARISQHKLLDNWDLSARRASAVAAMVISAIKADVSTQEFQRQIHISGYADKKPPNVAGGDTSPDKKQFRRVEFRFMIDPYILYQAQSRNQK